MKTRICEDCEFEHGPLLDESPELYEAHQLAITLRVAGVRFKLQDREINTEGAALVNKLNRFLRMLDEKAIEVKFNDFDHRPAVIRSPSPHPSRKP